MIVRSIAARLTLLQQLIAVFVVAGFAGSALVFTAQSLLNDETSLLRNVARRGAGEFDREMGEEGSIPAAAQSLLAGEPPSHVQMKLYAPDGAVLGATPDPDAAEGGKEREAERLEESAAAHRHEERATAQCGVVVAASVGTLARENTLQRLTLVMGWIALPLMVLVYVITGQATRRALRPLETMTRRVETIPSARPREGIAPPVGLSEIDKLTGAFNELLMRLDETLLSERRFTAEASHELRTPLTALSGEIEMALADPMLGAKARDGLLLAAGQARQMQQLVEALLLLRRLGDSPANADARGFEPVNLADLVREARPSLLRVYPGRDADLSLELPDEVLVAGHPALLASAVGNLLDNALKFTRAGQSVHVVLGDAGGRAEIVVEDAGLGIPPLEAKRIFEPFFRGPEARATTAGFGLGLPILKRVIQAHGGDVALEPASIGGARFVLHLPLWSAAGA